MSTAIPPPPPPPRRRRADRWIGRLGQAKLDLDRAKAAYEELAELVRTELPLGRYTDGAFEVVITRNRTFDKAKALAEFGARICTPAVDLKLARYVLTGEQFESFYVEENPRVIVREVGDEQA